MNSPLIRAPDKMRILALSRDLGSMQAIIPVVSLLQCHPSIDIRLFSPIEFHALLSAWNIAFSTFDVGAFSKNPEAYTAHLFDEVEPQLLFMGSSPARKSSPETPEQFAIIESRRRHTKSVAVLDYWGMYSERFSMHGMLADDLLLPDRLCVLDRRCKFDLHNLGVSFDRMLITHNPWMDDVAKESFEPPPPSDSLDGVGWRVLFVSQPLLGKYSSNKMVPHYDLLSALIRSLPETFSGRHRILVWKHPSEEDRWEDVSKYSTNDVDVFVSTERGASVLAHVDAVATVHSTVSYEALYYGTPLLSLRCGVVRNPPSYVDELGLSTLVETECELKSFFASTDIHMLRMRMLESKKRLLEEGVFFSDGNATQRVVNEVLRLLDIPAYQ